MRIAELLERQRPVFSFEFFPPKTDEGHRTLRNTLEVLKDDEPNFVSVTYGAGGTTRELTVDLTARIKQEIGIEAMAHLTCVGHSAAEIAAVVDRLRDAGIENVLALRGDPPKGQTEFVPPADGFAHGSELVGFLRSRYSDLCLGSACYPEGHVECVSRESDLEFLKRKVDAGADFLITQLFFAAEDYFAFVERARAAGIAVPIVPGLMPITNVSQLERMTTMCGCRIPDALRARLEQVRADEAAVVSTGIEWATDQARALLAGGAPGIHFYTLNRSLSTRMVYLNLQQG
jgi:methylenetetrahydrofolate reductase (NADPH)